MSQLAEVELQGRIREQRGFLEVKHWRRLRRAVAVLLLSPQREVETRVNWLREFQGWWRLEVEVERLEDAEDANTGEAEKKTGLG